MLTARPANLRFVVVTAVALAAFLSIDHWLHDAGGFLRAFGSATEEGQIQSKVARSRRIASVADVIAFGSSYFRSGISGQPFLERRLLPWNFAVSGGATLTDYFALSRIAEVLSSRSRKPALLVELRVDALTAQSSTLWAEYPQYLGIVRSRTEAFANARPLWSTFRAYGMSSQFISSLVVPSGLYRSHTAQLFITPDALAGYFYGMEDVTGYSPLYTVALKALTAGLEAAPISSDRWLPGKVEFLRRFLRLARAAGCPVVLIEQPTMLMGADAGRFDNLIDTLSAEFGELRVIKTSELELRLDDFDVSGHLNIRGSDRLAVRIIELLELTPQPDFESRVAAAFEALELPALNIWTLPSSLAKPTASETVTITRSERQSPFVALSPEIPVRPGHEYTFESRLNVTRGQVMYRMIWNNAEGVQRHSVLITPSTIGAFGNTRVFLRGTPTADRIRVEVSDYSVTTTGIAAEARFQPIRLWRDQLEEPHVRH